MRDALIAVQGLSFIALGALLLRAGDWKLGGAQLCLAVVTVLVYT